MLGGELPGVPLTNSKILVSIIVQKKSPLVGSFRYWLILVIEMVLECLKRTVFMYHNTSQLTKRKKEKDRFCVAIAKK